MEPPCSREELQRYFGVLTIDEFAEKYGVGRSTVKRWSRYYGFKKWPRVHRSVPNSARDSKNVHASKEPISNDDDDAPSHLVFVSNQGPTSNAHEMLDLAAIRDTRKKQKLNNMLENRVDLEEREENEAIAPLNELQQESFMSMNGPQRILLQWFVFNKAGDKRELLVNFEYENLVREDILVSLTPMAWFNGNVINTVASMLTKQELRLSNNPQLRKTWYLPTYVHGALCNDPVDFESIYNRHRWYMGDLHACEKIFIPVNEMSRHWYMCSIDLKNKVIEVLDSLPNQGCCSRLREVVKLRKQFAELLRYIGGTEDDVLKLESLGINSPGWVPNQENDYDCGLFVIKFMHEEFGPDKVFQKLDSKAERVKLAIDMVLHVDNKQRQTILEKVKELVTLTQACGGNWETLGQELPEHQRMDAVNSMIYEANARVRDPVYGCVGVISYLQQQIDVLQAQLAVAQVEVIRMQAAQFLSSSLLVTPENNNNIMTRHNHPSAQTTSTTRQFLDFGMDQTNMEEPLWQ